MPGDQQSRKRRLESAVGYIHERWGPDALRRGRADGAAVPHISTGFPALDAALGTGGLPRGRLSVLSGAPTSGKRTLAALVMAQAQRGNRRLAAWIDLAQTCDADYLARCGVDLGRLLVGRPGDGREALDMLVTLGERSELAVVVFDGWGALASDASTRQYAAAALDGLAPRLAHSRAALLVLDEPPPLLQGLVAAIAGDPADQALGQQCAVRLALSRERWISLGPDVRGYQIQVQIQKNKLGPAGGAVRLEIRFNGTVRGEGL